MLGGNAGPGQKAMRASGGVDFPAEVCQAAGEIVCAILCWKGR